MEQVTVMRVMFWEKVIDIQKFVSRAMVRAALRQMKDWFNSNEPIPLEFGDHRSIETKIRDERIKLDSKYPYFF